MVNVYIISGFLGAGKTTFIQKLLNEKKFEKVMLLENEFGEIGVDSAFFDKTLDVKEINNGCICCSLRGDFKDALEEIEDMGITDLIIEPSGVGKLSDIIDVVKGDPDFRIISHVCIVDVKTAMKYHLNFKEYFDDQVKAANAIILSHLDVCSDDKVAEVVNMLKELNPNVYITNKPISAFKIDELLDVIIAGGEILPELDEHHECDDEECHCHHHHHDHDHHHDEDEDEHEHHHHHHHDDDDDEDEPFKNVAIRTQYVFSIEELENILNKMPENIIRAKGYVNGEKGTIYFNYVLNEYNIYYGETRNDTLVVIIGTDIDKKGLRETFHE